MIFRYKGWRICWISLRVIIFGRVAFLLLEVAKIGFFEGMENDLSVPLSVYSVNSVVSLLLRL